jgi:hypothetical protein
VYVQHLIEADSVRVWESVMFLAGGDKKEEVKQGAQGEGLPSSFAAGRGACLDKAGAREDGGRRDEERVEGIEGGTSSIFRLRY